jgi:glycosyltransferase involved in cell wall biosynthesis
VTETRNVPGGQGIEPGGNSSAAVRGIKMGARFDHRNGALRVAHVVSHPIQYFAPLYRELSHRQEIDLTVFFYSDAGARQYKDREFGTEITWDTGVLEGYTHELCRSARGRSPERVRRSAQLDVVRAITRGSFDVVWAHGYSAPTTWMVAATARRTGAGFMLRDEQTLLHQRSPARALLKRVALGELLRDATVLYIGENNRRYFEHFGVPPDRLVRAVYCVDNERLRDVASELKPQRHQLRAEWGLNPQTPVILFVGKLIVKKRPMTLLKAFAQVRRHHEAQLLYVGDGALRAELEQCVRERVIPDVHFAGFLNQSELPRAYALADLLALPSAFHETWGLVVNEAMNFGLPIVLSQKVGCAPDLVSEGRNGYVVKVDDEENLAKALERLITNAQLRARFGTYSAAVIEDYSISRCADGIVEGAFRAARPKRSQDRREPIAIQARQS